MATIHIYDAFGDDPQPAVLILCFPTGTFYEAQIAGLACEQRKAEGLALSLGAYAQDFDDCSYGCAFMDDAGRARLADDLGAYFQRVPPKHITLQIDRNRLAEMEEGWWPVLVTGRIVPYLKEEPPDNHWYGELIDWRGYLHTGNCD